MATTTISTNINNSKKEGILLEKCTRMKVFSEKLQNKYQDETEARPKHHGLQYEEVRKNMTVRAIDKMTVDFLLGD